MPQQTPAEFGPLEVRLMDLAWARQGEFSVRDAAEHLASLAYTTVMTTLDRLFKKGYLNRRMQDRAFFYSARYSRAELEQRQAGKLVSGLFSNSHSSPEALISCLVDAVGQYDESLLDELERRIAAKREELRNGETA